MNDRYISMHGSIFLLSEVCNIYLSYSISPNFLFRMMNITRPEKRLSSSPDTVKFPYLHETLVYHILLRSPVKSLLRFKCASKKCNSWITTPEFIKTHLKISSADNQLKHHRLLSVPHRFPRIVSSHSLHVHPDVISNRTVLDFPIQSNRSGEVRYVGYVNGIVYIYHDSPTADVVIIWNPSTRKLIKKWSVVTSANSWGLYYDEGSDDYMLIVFNGYYLREHDYRVFVNLYSLKKDSRRIYQTSYSEGRLKRRQRAFYCNGIVHCLAMEVDNDSTTTYNIAAFNPVDGNFESIPMPNYGNNYHSTAFPNVMKLGEFLAVTHNEPYSGKNVVYVMKDYVGKVWTKLFSIPVYGYEYPSQPVSMFKNGMICCRSQRLVELYIKRRFIMQNFEAGWADEVTCYVESLISPEIDDDDDDDDDEDNDANA